MGVPWLIGAFMLVMVSGGSLLTLGLSCFVLGGLQVLVSTFVSPILGGLTIAVLAAVVAAAQTGGICPCLSLGSAVRSAASSSWPGLPRALTGMALPALVAAGLVVAGPWILDTYTLNILVRAFFVAIAAITVDILWGISGTLTFGQSAFFGFGAYALAIGFTQFGFGSWQVLLALGAAVGIAAAVAGFVGWLSFYPGSTPLYASVVSLVLPIVLVQLLYSGGTFTGSSSGLVGFESFDLSLESWFRLAGRGRCHPDRRLDNARQRRRARARRDARQRRALQLSRDRYRAACASVLRWSQALWPALAGFGYVGFSGVAAPENAGFVFGTQLVVMVALGGRGIPGWRGRGRLGDRSRQCLSCKQPALRLGTDRRRRLRGGHRRSARRSVRQSARGRQRGTSPLRAGAGAGLVPGHPGYAGACGGCADRNDVVVQADGVSKRFGSLSVLSGVSFTARQGELVSIVGPNGAGKTTLIRCLADGRERTEGAVRIAGHSIHRLAPDRIVGLGLGRKFQAASVFETLNVADCLRIARVRSERPSLIGASPVLALPAAARAVVESSGLAERLGEEARFLSHGLKQALELAMVLALEPQVLLLDEPTAGLTRAERQGFAGVLTGLVARERLCVLIIEHDLDFVRQISSRIILLHQGRVALDGPVADVVDDPLIREIYTGNTHAAAREVTS